MQAKLVLCCVTCLLFEALAAVSDASAQDTLTAGTVISRAHARAPQVLEAETRVQEARGRLIGARAWQNPELEGVAGRPEGGERRVEAELTLPVGLGFKRSRRVRAATAELRSEEQLARDTTRQAVGTALAAFFRTLHAGLRRDVAERRLALAEQLTTVARERVAAGDAAELETHVADVELSRAQSEIRAEEQELTAARAELALILGLPTPSTLVIQGDLSDRSLLPDVADTLSLETRPDVLAAESRVTAAAAERSLAGLALLPDMSFRLNYEQEENSETWMPGLALTLPLFDRGQGERAQSQARLNRSRLERDRLRVAAQAEYEAARERYASAIAAAAELEARGLPSSARVEGMVEESYRAGKTDLGSLLVLRREALETRREHLDRLLDAALRGIDLALASGQWPQEQQTERNEK